MLCPVCNKKHRKYPAECISSAHLYCKADEMARYLKEAGYWKMFCDEVDNLVDLLIQLGGTKI